MMYRFSILLVFAFLGGVMPKSEAEISPQVSARVWRVQDGLADHVIQAIVSGPDHLLWIGTPRGLLRFDGHTFMPYASEGRDELASGVTCLTVASDGSVYAGTEGAGIVRFHGAHTELLGIDQGIKDPIIRVVLEDSRHRIWVGTDHGIFVRDHGAFENAFTHGAYTTIGSSALFQDRAGAVWTGGSDLLRVSKGQTESFQLPSQGGSVRVKALIEDEDGTLFAGAVSGLYARTPKGNFAQVREVPGTVRMFGRLPSGELLVGTAGFGLYVRRAGHFQHANISALPSQTLFSSATDGEGNSWIGTQSGLVRFSPTGLSLIPLPTFSSDFGTISRDKNDSFWFCSNGVYHLRGQESQAYRFPWLSSSIVRSVMRDTNGALWIGTTGKGVYRVGADGRHDEFTQEVGNNYIRGFLEAHSGGVWIATDGGISLWRDGHISNFHKIYGAPHTLVTSMFEDREGRLWLGTQRGIYLFQNERFQPLPEALKLPSGPAWSVYGTSDAIWMGTNSGLFLWRSGVVRRVAVDETKEAILNIMESNGILWISGPTQIMRIPEMDLLRIADADSPPQSASLQTYSVTDAFPSAELFAGLPQSGSVDSDGSAWFPSSLGPIHVELDRTAWPLRKVPMTIHIVVDGNPMSLSTPINLRADTQTLQVEYAPVMLSSQAGIRFRQRLMPGGNWSSLSAARTAVFTGMSVGRHTYQVEAVDAQEHVLGQAQFDFYQNAYLYQKPWFWSILCLVFAAGILLTYRLRIARLRIAFDAVAKERTRLAREMHDTLIQGCQAVSALLEAIAGPTIDLQHQRTWLEHARDQIKTTIVEARAAVWDLRSQDADESLESKLSHMTQHNPGASRAVISFTKRGSDPRLSHTVTHELVMSTREALINALTHSTATEIRLELLCARRQLVIEVSDNGQGFIVGSLEMTDGRFGIRGMKERMTRIGGECTVLSIPSGGTVVKLTYPIAPEKWPHGDL